MENLFLALLEISLSSSLVILPVVFLSPALNKRFSLKWKYLLWGLLALRMLIPANFAFNGISAQFEFVIPETAKFDAVSPVAQYPSFLSAESSSDREEEVHSSIPSETDASADLSQISPVPNSSNDNKNNLFLSHPRSPLTIVTSIWLCGAVLILFWHLFSFLHFRHKLLINSHIISLAGLPKELSSLFYNKNGSKPIASLLISNGVSSPIAVGIFKPLLVLPAKEFDGTSLSFIFSHELTHIRRKDLCYKFLLVLTASVHWFNPAAWLMLRCASQDLELYCDSLVTKTFDAAQRRAYSETILSVVPLVHHVRSFSTCFSSSKKALKKRLFNILSTQKRRSGLFVLLVSVVLLLIGSILISCSSTSQTDPLHLPAITPKKLKAEPRELHLEVNGTPLYFTEDEAIIEVIDDHNISPYDLPQYYRVDLITGRAEFLAERKIAILGSNTILCSNRYACQIAEFYEGINPVSPYSLAVTDLETGESRYFPIDTTSPNAHASLIPCEDRFFCILREPYFSPDYSVIFRTNYSLRLYDPLTGEYILFAESSVDESSGVFLRDVAVCNNLVYLFCLSSQTGTAYIEIYNMDATLLKTVPVSSTDLITAALEERYTDPSWDNSPWSILPTADGSYIIVTFSKEAYLFQYSAERNRYEPVGTVPCYTFSNTFSPKNTTFLWFQEFFESGTVTYLFNPFNKTLYQLSFPSHLSSGLIFENSSGDLIISLLDGFNIGTQYYLSFSNLDVPQ